MEDKKDRYNDYKKKKRERESTLSQQENRD